MSKVYIFTSGEYGDSHLIVPSFRVWREGKVFTYKLVTAIYVPPGSSFKLALCIVDAGSPLILGMVTLP